VRPKRQTTEILARKINTELTPFLTDNYSIAFPKINIISMDFIEQSDIRSWLVRMNGLPQKALSHV
jgi:hypothetical protein